MSFTKPSTAVKWAVSSMTGAPTLNGTAGSLIAVLDAFLVTGFGTKAVDSAQVTDGICRLSFTGTSAALEHTVISVAGVTGDGAVLNGEQRVSAVSSTYVEFPCDLPDGPLTGTITFKMAPLGWEKVFSKTNVAVYRSQDPAATRCYLRVDDTDPRNARVVGYLSMTDVDTGFGSFPTGAQVPGGGYWPKSTAAGAGGKLWAICGDAKGFRLLIHTAVVSNGVSGSVWEFGDIDALRSGDPYACLLQCAATDVASSTASQGAEYVSPANGGGAYFPKSVLALGSAVAATHGVESLIVGSGVAGAVAGVMLPQYPNPAGNTLLFTRKTYMDPGVGLRGYSRGLHIPAQVCHGGFNTLDTEDGQGVLSGCKLMAWKCGSPAGAVSQGVVFVDITGPWGV